MDKRLILVLGGARGGKSSYAEGLALELGGADVVYVATAEALDEEMRERIAKHRAARPAGWRTVEAPSLCARPLDEVLGGARVVLLDCLTLLTSNALLAPQGARPTSGEAQPAPEKAEPAPQEAQPAKQEPKPVQDEAALSGEAEAKVEEEVACLLAAYAAGEATWVVVSNEVGLGLVPDNPLGRLYRDVLGRANQRVAAAADEVVFLVAGLPLRLK